MKILLIFLMLCISFSYGITVGVYQYPPYQLIAIVKKLIIPGDSLSNEALNKFDGCNLPKTSSLNGNTHAFIGHAYGSPSVATFESFLSPNAENFIRENLSKLNTVIFTGDVFFAPSIEKWNKLRIISGMNLDIFITPGNHDVKRPDSNDVFKISEFGKKNYPILTNLDNTPLILENSIQSNWIVSNITIDLINNIDTETIIIARHNTPIKDLLSLVNSGQGMSKNLESIEEFSQKFNRNKKYYWIIGDSGAFNRLPRLSCLTFKNHTFLLNGLGQIEGDSIILYRNKKFLEYMLRP
jgi:hypothetical protein